MTLLVRRFHPALLTGLKYCRCGDWDRPTVYCAAIALTFLGALSDPAGARGRVEGPEARFWDKAWPYVLHGLTASELAAFLLELNLGLHPVEVPLSSLSSLCHRALFRSWVLVLTTGREQAMVVVGVEGVQRGHRFQTKALLLLDPTEPAPEWEGYNAKLPFPSPTGKPSPFDSAVLVRPAPRHRQERR